MSLCGFDVFYIKARCCTVPVSDAVEGWRLFHAVHCRGLAETCTGCAGDAVINFTSPGAWNTQVIPRRNTMACTLYGRFQCVLFMDITTPACFFLHYCADLLHRLIVRRSTPHIAKYFYGGYCKCLEPKTITCSGGCP